MSLSVSENDAFRLIETHAHKGSALNIGAGTIPNPHCLDQYDQVVRVDYKVYTDIPYTKVDLNSESLPFSDNAFDIVFSYNVFEHLRYPWRVADECMRVIKPGGLCLTIAPFAWRYHPVPEDYFRFSHKAMESLFDKLEVCVSGYDIHKRRKVQKGRYVKDQPPIDKMGGWLESWETVFVGRKPNC
jgi:SAM-dependent methyltransferase